jgi:hypothetical protein
MSRDQQAIEAIRPSIRELSGSANDYDALLELIGPAHFVLLGEGSDRGHRGHKPGTSRTAQT